MSRAYFKRRRLSLWISQGGRCHWCGCICVAMDTHTKHPPKNLATVDHLRSRLDPTRREPNTSKEKRLVMACWQCNVNRAAEEVSKLPIEELRERSQRKRRRTA